jgi:hypothetical protein
MARIIGQIDGTGMGDGQFPFGKGLLNSTALRLPPTSKSASAGEVIIDIPSNDNGVSIDPLSGIIEILNDDGSVDIDLNPQDREALDRPSKHGDNLAMLLGDDELGRISSDVLEGIQQDEMSRQQWLNDRAEGMRLLGLQLKGPRSSIDMATALEGMSSVDHPMLLEAVLNFWANASGEFLPAAGPVKIDDKLGTNQESLELAETLEGDLNYYLTTVATEYYPDSSRQLLNIGFGGMGIKKVYNCPLRQRPVSEAVDIVNFIVSNAATDLRNSGRYTHQIQMRPSVLKRMQIAGAYRDVPLITPAGVVPNPVDQAKAEINGVQIISQQTEDREHTIYECYCELDIRGFEDKKGSKRTGLPLPYRVVIDKDSTQILEIRRNWKEGDKTKTAKVNFVVYVLIPGFGFYGIGLLNILGNTTKAMTAAWRETLDAGMFANFPGFLFSKIMGRQNTNDFRVPPGGGVPIQHDGDDIRKAVMALPYKDVSPAFVGFQDKVTEQGRNLGGTTQIKVAEGRADAPVGTTLANIEQATRVEKATHKELWRAQGLEFQLLKECFRENPESFVEAIKVRGGTDWDVEKFKLALEDASLVPQADPNTPSHMHRLMKAMGLIQVDKAYPGVLDPVGIVDRVVTMLGLGDFETMRNKTPPGGQMPPELQVEMQRLMLDGQKLADKSADREWKMRFEVMKGRMALINQQAEQAKREHELQVQTMQQQDNSLQHSTDLRQSEMELRGTEVEAAADVHVADQGVEAARVTGAHDVKAETVKVKGEDAREKTEDTKGTHAVAAAKAKPKPKSASKKP